MKFQLLGDFCFFFVLLVVCFCFYRFLIFPVKLKFLYGGVFFLKELLYAKCISEEEYHSSKRPLLQRLAVQGAEIEAKHVVVGSKRETTDDEWSVIDLKDEKSNLGKENSISSSKDKQKQTSSAIKEQIKGAASVFSFASSKKERGILNPVSENCFERNELAESTENPFWNTHLREKDSETKSILMVESLPNEPVKVKKLKKPFKALFGVDDQHRGEPESEGKSKSGGKKQWGFDGFKKWKKNDSEDETAPLSLDEKSDGGAYLGQLVAEPIGEGPDTKQIKRKLHPNGAPSDFFVDKVSHSYTCTIIYSLKPLYDPNLKLFFLLHP